MAEITALDSSIAELTEATRELYEEMINDPKLDEKVSRVWNLFRKHHQAAAGVVDAWVKRQAFENSSELVQKVVKELTDNAEEIRQKVVELIKSVSADSALKNNLQKAAWIMLQDHMELTERVFNAGMQTYSTITNGV
jgi:Arc/MetJ-type ribon-helix-helix transcriptional regulator